MSDDQDTTAPTVTIKREFERFVYPSWDGWALFLAENIGDAALEEMRVRAALARAGMDENGRVTVKWELDR